MGTRQIQQREAGAAKATLRVASSSTDGRPPIVVLEGEFDLDTVPEIDPFLRRTLGPLYHQDDLVIDLARTTFIDSSFIGFLVRLSAAQRAERRELLLVRPCGQVRRVFAIVGLHNVVPVFDTIDAAVTSLLSGRGAVIPPAFRTAGL